MVKMTYFCGGYNSSWPKFLYFGVEYWQISCHQLTECFAKLLPSYAGCHAAIFYCCRLCLVPGGPGQAHRSGQLGRRNVAVTCSGSTQSWYPQSFLKLQALSKLGVCKTGFVKVLSYQTLSAKNKTDLECTLYREAPSLQESFKPDRSRDTGSDHSD